MSLAYNQGCPPLYQPPGFVDKDDFQEGDAQAMCKSLAADSEEIVGMLETGYHQVRVTVRLANSEAQESPIDLQDTEMSKQLQAMQKTSSSHSNNLLSTLKGSTSAAKRRADGPTPTPNSKRVKATGSSLPPTSDTTPRMARASALKSSQNLGHAVVDYSKPVGQRELPVNLVAGHKGSSNVMGTRLAVTSLAKLIVHCYALQKATRGAEGDLFDEDLLAEGNIKRLTRSTNVRCECGSGKQSGGMVSLCFDCPSNILTHPVILRSLRKLAA